MKQSGTSHCLSHWLRLSSVKDVTRAAESSYTHIIALRTRDGLIRYTVSVRFRPKLLEWISGRNKNLTPSITFHKSTSQN